MLRLSELFTPVRRVILTRFSIPLKGGFLFYPLDLQEHLCYNLLVNIL